MRTKKLLQLPKPHLSYSQIMLWKSDKKRYRKLYFEGNKLFQLNNSGLEYGKMVADALEQSEQTGNLMTDAAMQMLDKYDVRDQEISVDIKTKYGWFTVLGRPDTLNSVTKAFREYKTGKGKWTQVKAQNHPQMIFYAMLIYLKYGVTLTEAYLDWIETEDESHDVIDEDGFNWGAQTKIVATSRVEKFKVTFTLMDILNCIAETTKIALEIELDFVSYIPEATL